MEEIVSTFVKASGGLVLPGIPSQPKKAAKKSATSEQVRLVPAKVGPLGRAQTVLIECPTWCAEDHREQVRFIEDITHYSDCDVVQLNTLTDDDTGHSEMYAGISLDPIADDPRLRAAHVLITDAAGDAYLTPEMADHYADDLIAFASQIRGKARQVRLFNKAGQ